MPRLCCLLVSLLIATASNAATLSVGTDKLTYSVGETVTVTVFGDDGEELGSPVLAYSMYGRLAYNGALVDSGTRTQLQVVGESGNWVLGPLSEADTNAPGPGSFSDAFRQLTLPADTALNLPGTLSTVTLIATAVGIVDLNWVTDGDEPLFFFGLTTAPGTSFTIVPEFGTATLFALGLLGLAGWRRARA